MGTVGSLCLAIISMHFPHIVKAFMKHWLLNYTELLFLEGIPQGSSFCVVLYEITYTIVYKKCNRDCRMVTKSISYLYEAIDDVCTYGILIVGISQLYYYYAILQCSKLWLLSLKSDCSIRVYTRPYINMVTVLLEL